MGRDTFNFRRTAPPRRPVLRVNPQRLPNLLLQQKFLRRRLRLWGLSEEWLFTIPPVTKGLAWTLQQLAMASPRTWMLTPPTNSRRPLEMLRRTRPSTCRLAFAGAAWRRM